ADLTLATGDTASVRVELEPEAPAP
ncbi:MAG: hypothetical protein ACI8TP_005049, partial [Acidimicrobiales bacterium]